MPYYYFNNTIDTNGNHEVHDEECSYLPGITNRTYISYESDCASAIATARILHSSKSFDGCYYCSRNCHTG